MLAYLFLHKCPNEKCGRPISRIVLAPQPLPDRHFFENPMPLTCGQENCGWTGSSNEAHVVWRNAAEPIDWPE